MARGNISSARTSGLTMSRLLLLLFISSVALADPPDGYYETVVGLTSSELISKQNVTQVKKIGL